MKREKQEFSQQEAERVRPNNPEAVRLGEKSTQDPEIAVNISDKRSSPTATDIILTSHEHNDFTPESIINRNELQLQMSQFSLQSQEKLEMLHGNNVRLQKMLNVKKTFHTLQEGYSKLIKASRETNKKRNKVL
ncbi:hypothetical protein O181_008802 [Austropuccinia psidii MF-1]|uniref:Uncharacterized protein n=1 Tax=Austropuccinia psidii MF-1 TaxID=1389203 RepID=A0A9Q3BPI0_9BASI|nr:hypothetical protein [Austropuccinia psidii MF-1]